MSSSGSSDVESGAKEARGEARPPFASAGGKLGSGAPTGYSLLTPSDRRTVGPSADGGRALALTCRGSHSWSRGAGSARPGSLGSGSGLVGVDFDKLAVPES